MPGNRWRDTRCWSRRRSMVRRREPPVQRKVRARHGREFMRRVVYGVPGSDGRERDLRGRCVRPEVPVRRDVVQRGVRVARERCVQLWRVWKRLPIGSELFGGRVRHGLPRGDQPVWRYLRRRPGRRVHFDRERWLRPVGDDGVHRGKRGVLGVSAHLRSLHVARQRRVHRVGRLRLREWNAPLRDQMRVGLGGDVVRRVVLGVPCADGRKRDVRGWGVRAVVSERRDGVQRGVRGACDGCVPLR